MVRGTIASEIRDVIACQAGEWAVAEIRDMVSGATASKVLVVVMRLVEQGLVQRIGYSRGPNSKVRPTYMTMGDIPSGCRDLAAQRDPSHPREDDRVCTSTRHAVGS